VFLARSQLVPAQAVACNRSNSRVIGITPLLAANCRSMQRLDARRSACVAARASSRGQVRVCESASDAMFQFAKIISHGLVALNSALLLCLAVIPLATPLLAEESEPELEPRAVGKRWRAGPVPCAFPLCRRCQSGGRNCDVFRGDCVLQCVRSVERTASFFLSPFNSCWTEEHLVRNVDGGRASLITEGLDRRWLET
jgi:hypothetical protein